MIYKTIRKSAVNVDEERQFNFRFAFTAGLSNMSLILNVVGYSKHPARLVSHVVEAIAQW